MNPKNAGRKDILSGLRFLFTHRTETTSRCRGNRIRKISESIAVHTFSQWVEPSKLCEHKTTLIDQSLTPIITHYEPA